jgi:hypothetical protein
MDSIALAEQGDRILDTLIDELDNINQVRQVGHVKDYLKEIRYKLTICKSDGESGQE